ncbi:hypothetical protein CY35_09G008700 [Sphagnum magellanicum]|nr:hypothetical protein CY35_09G008700 [Sphagnum magellanicum]
MRPLLKERNGSLCSAITRILGPYSGTLQGLCRTNPMGVSTRASTMHIYKVILMGGQWPIAFNCEISSTVYLTEIFSHSQSPFLKMQPS